MQQHVQQQHAWRVLHIKSLEQVKVMVTALPLLMLLAVVMIFTKPRQQQQQKGQQQQLLLPSWAARRWRTMHPAAPGPPRLPDMPALSRGRMLMEILPQHSVMP